MSSLVCSNIAKLKLPAPLRVKEYFEELHANFKHEECYKTNAHYIQKVDGQLIMRTFSVRIRKNGEMEYSETVRRGEDLEPVFCHCEYGYLAGWIVDYGYEWSKYDTYPGWNKKVGYLWGKYINRDEIDPEYDPHHSYTYGTGLEYFEYILRLRDEPRIELLVKNGYAPLVKSLNMLGKDEKNISKILKVDPKWTEYLKGKNRIYLIACRKYKTEAEVEMYVHMATHNHLKGILKYVKDHMAKYLEYIRNPPYDTVYDINEGMYKDYLDMAYKLGYPLNENRYLFPEDIQEAHDKALNELKVMKGKILQKGFDKQYEKLAKLAFENQQLLIRPAKDNDELVNESEQLHHCVRTYAEKHAKGITAIFFIRQTKNPDKPYVTLELVNKRVVQVRADHNTVPAPEVWQFVDQWKEVYKLI